MITEKQLLEKFRAYVTYRKELAGLPETVTERIASTEARCQELGQWLKAMGVDLSDKTIRPFLESGTLPDSVIRDYTGYDPYDGIWILVPEQNLLIYAEEGTGDNLLPEDRQRGYEDYVEYRTYSMDDTIEESDGGELLLKELFQETYPDTAACVPDLLDEICEDRTIEYCILPGDVAAIIDRR